MEIKKVTINNTSITYQEVGEGDVLLFLHGFCGGLGYWNKVLPELAKNYRVIALDLLGHGSSDLPDGDHSMESFADHLALFCKELNLEQVTLFGHSLGGYITLAFAEKYPNHLRAFSLIHSTAYPDTAEGKVARDQNINKITEAGIRPFVDGLVPKLFSIENVEKQTAEVEFAKQIGWETSVPGAITSLEAMRDRVDRNHVLKESEQPILLVAGDGDKVIPADKTFSVEKENIHSVLISGAGHMSMLETPSILVEEIKNWLETIKGEG